MVCQRDRCGCGAFCRRIFCRSKPPNEEQEEGQPVTLTQLANAKDVKFTQTLTEPLAIGSHIICKGTPSEELPWFAINIGSGDVDSGTADIAVHFNVRIPQCYVVRNTRRHGKWGPEETTAYRLFPFKYDQPFTIEILMDEKESFWSVDGVHYCNYTHRNPNPFSAAWVQITGVRDASLTIEKTDTYPKLASPMNEVPCRSSIDNAPEEQEPSWQPNSTVGLLKGVPEGYQVVIRGRLRLLLHSFVLELADNAREWPRPNVPIHVNVRAHVESQRDRQLVVFNAWLGEWGPERRQRTARLIPGTQTTFRIVRGPNNWATFADDILIGELEFRSSPNAVRALRVRGDLYPQEIYICPASSSPVREDS